MNLGLMDKCNMLKSLNFEVEIIEEKPKKIEEITEKTFSVESPTTKILSENILSYINYNCIDKINELTKAVNYLLEKSEDNG